MLELVVLPSPAVEHFLLHDAAVTTDTRHSWAGGRQILQAELMVHQSRCCLKVVSLHPCKLAFFEAGASCVLVQTVTMGNIQNASDHRRPKRG